MAGLRPNQDWSAPSGHPAALAQGLWAGAAAIVVLVAAGLLGDAGIVLAIALTAVVPGLLLPLTVGDVLWTRRASHPWLSLALAAGILAALAWATVSFVLPSGLPMPQSFTDEVEVALPTLAGLLAGAERCAAWGRLGWRDRLLGAAAGYATVGGVFLVGAEWLSWAVLLGALALRLPANARLAFAALSGAGALGLGQFIDGVWTARAVEAAAFVLYAGVSLPSCGSVPRGRLARQAWALRPRPTVKASDRKAFGRWAGSVGMSGEAFAPRPAEAPAHRHASVPLRFPWSGALDVGRHLGWMVLGGLACLVAAVLAGEAVGAPVAATWWTVGGAVGVAIALLYAGAAWRRGATGHWFDLAAGASTTLGLALGTTTSLAFALPALAAAPLSALLRRDTATQVAALATLPVGVLAFQAASDLHEPWIVMAVAALAASPALVRLRGAALVAGLLALAAVAVSAAL